MSKIDTDPRVLRQLAGMTNDIMFLTDGTRIIDGSGFKKLAGYKVTGPPKPSQTGKRIKDDQIVEEYVQLYRPGNNSITDLKSLSEIYLHEQRPILLFDIENSIRSFDSITHQLATSNEDPHLVIYPVVVACDGTIWQARQTFEPSYGDHKSTFISFIQFLWRVGQMEETVNSGIWKISLQGSAPYTSGYQDFNIQNSNAEILTFLQKEHLYSKSSFLKDVIGLSDKMIEVVGHYYLGRTAEQIAKDVVFGEDEYATKLSRSSICNIAEEILSKFRHHFPLYMKDNHYSQHTGGTMHALARAMWKMDFK